MCLKEYKTLIQFVILYVLLRFRERVAALYTYGTVGIRERFCKSSTVSVTLQTGLVLRKARD